ncbi:MAG: hypothetical protein IJY42_00540, partial [Clostridia bacterium]|nr:hypothetical protein [Clostridia bacterium]
MNGSFRMLALMMAGLFLLASGCQASFSEERDPTSNVTSPPITTTSGADTVLTTESSAETTVSS